MKEKERAPRSVRRSDAQGIQDDDADESIAALKICNQIQTQIKDFKARHRINSKNKS